MNKALFLACLMVGAAIAEPTEKEPFWTEYALSFSVQDGHQPFLTMRWWSMKAPGPFQEYAEIWRKNVRVGYGDRFLVEDITGLDYDGNKKKDKVVVVTILDTITKERITFRSDDPKHRLVMSYSKEWMKDWAENQSKQPKRPKAKKSQGAD